VALVVAVTIAAVVSLRGNDSVEPAKERPAARHTRPRTARGVSWVAQANAVCRLGRRLYPNITLGAAGDQDTTEYAVSKLVSEIEAIATSPPSSGVRELEHEGQAAVAAWASLATSESTVTPRDKQEAARTANRYVNRLVALGAAACAPLRLRTA
jgi:hypothetical protein